MADPKASCTFRFNGASSSREKFYSLWFFRGTSHYPTEQVFVARLLRREITAIVVLAGTPGFLLAQPAGCADRNPGGGASSHTACCSLFGA